MTCLRSPRVAELRFDPSHLGSFLPSSRLSQLVPFPLGRVTPGHLTLGRDSGTGGEGGPGGRGVWPVAGALAPTPLSAVPSLWACGFLSLEGGCPWALEVAGPGWRLDVGSLFSLSWVLVSIL